jgi:AraC family transcriptional regulator
MAGDWFAVHAVLRRDSLAGRGLLSPRGAARLDAGCRSSAVHHHVCGLHDADCRRDRVALPWTDLVQAGHQCSSGNHNLPRHRGADSPRSRCVLDRRISVWTPRPYATTLSNSSVEMLHRVSFKPPISGMRSPLSAWTIVDMDLAYTCPAPSPSMETHVADNDPHGWVHHVILLLDVAARQIDHRDESAKCALIRAKSLLRKQVEPGLAATVPYQRGRLLSWQSRKVSQYIDEHISETLCVADLAALLKWSEAHFSRSFKQAFGESPYAFVIRRRVERAAQYMIETDLPLKDIALRCGFVDQPHLCRIFRQSMGHTPAAWRRARLMQTVGATDRFMTSTPSRFYSAPGGSPGRLRFTLPLLRDTASILPGDN